MRPPFVLLVCCGGLLVSCVAPATPSGTRRTAKPGQASAADGTAGLGAADGGLPAGVVGAKPLATIESVRAELDAGNPTRAKVTISGLLHDGSTSVQSVEQHRTAQGVEISVTTSRSPHSKAGVALIPFERIVSVDLGGMKPGACRITANEASTMLMLP